MMRARTFGVAAISAVAAALVLAGCGGGGDDTMTTTTGPVPPAPTTTAPAPSTAAAIAVAFKGPHGVLTRIVSPLPATCDDHSCEPWTLDHANSFAAMSPVSWSRQLKKYAVYPGFNMSVIPPVPLREDGWPGFIAVDSAVDMVDCAFPSDGATGCRFAVGGSSSGCGCISRVAPACAVIPGGSCNQANHTDWCSEDNASSFCAWKSSELPQMLKQFRERGGGDANRQGKKCNFCGYNEVAVNRQKWAAALPDAIWAFFVPDSCPPESTCYKGWAFWYADFKKKYGPKPIVGFNAANYDSPFHDLPQPAEPSAQAIEVDV